MTETKTLTPREKNLALIGLIISLPLVFASCVTMCQGDKPNAWQQGRYDDCMKEKRQVFKQGLIEADSHCAFWKTAKP